MRILVCGSRYLNNKDLVYKTLYELADEFDLWLTPDDKGNTLPSKMTIIEGGAKGADSLAADFAMVNWTGLKEFKADWDKYGKSAGYIRNKQMLDEGKPDLVLAFLAPDSRGTKNMIEQSKKAGVPVRVVEI